MCLEAVKMYGKRPIKLLNKIIKKRAIRMIIFE